MRQKNEGYMRNYQYPPWNKPEVIYWYVSDKMDKNGEPLNVWGFDTFEAAQQYADLFGGHVEITRPDGQFDLFNN